MSTHMVDAYGDLAPVETYDTDNGPVDTYGDPIPTELWEDKCTPDSAGVCTTCGNAS